MPSLYEDIIEALTPLVEAFDQLGILYYIGGSVASSVHGTPRKTQDVDVIADIRIEHARRLVQMLQDKYYIDENALKDSVNRHLSYNFIYLASMTKVDIIPLKRRAFTQEEARRAQLHTLEADAHPFNIASAEDAILTKLEWYHMGDRTSSRQWGDILGMLKRQGTALDLTYLSRWAADLRISDLLERALSEAGLIELL